MRRARCCFGAQEGSDTERTEASTQQPQAQSSSDSKAKFAAAKRVEINVPRTVDPQGIRGEVGYVKKSWMTPEGRLYEVLLGDAGPGMKTIEVKEEWLSRAGIVAQSENVVSVPLIDALKACKVHRVPTFQRRYCWSDIQWKKLWESIEGVRDNPDLNNHSLQRLMLMQKKDGSRLVLDGQQRLTTCTILLAALCHRFRALGDDKSAKRYDQYCAEGRLIPTMYDRPDFKRCLTEQRPEGDSAVVRAKRCFADLSDSLDRDQCTKMTEAVLNRLSVLTFVVSDADAIQDIYEKMAKRTEVMANMPMDLSSCRDCYAEGEGGKETPSTHWGPTGERLCAACASKYPGSTSMTPGIPMSPLDVIRNTVFDYYPNEAAMKEAYEAYWGPMELKLGGDTKDVEAGLTAFLQSQGFEVKRLWSMNKDFEGWWGAPAAGADTAAYATGRMQELLRSVEPRSTA